jgi:hypothetical protein
VPVDFSSITPSVSTEIAKQAVGLILTKWVTPKLESLKHKRVLDSQFEDYIYNGFPEYLHRSYDYQKSVNIVALGNAQVTIDEIYVPLTLTSEVKKETFRIESYDENFASKFRYILIEDTAGMGKTTVMKRLFTSAVEKNVGIPIFIELRRLVDGKSILDVLTDDINPLLASLDQELLIRLLESGDFIFFLDGYDEIPFEFKESITAHIKQFVSKAHRNVFFLTSRSDDALVSFGQFRKFKLNKLVVDEAISLINKYDDVSGFNLAEPLTEQIIAGLSRTDFLDLDSFLGNPLLVSFLYLTFKHKKDIPSVKTDFYRKVYDALYEEHDLSKDSYKRIKQSGLSSSGLHQVLRTLGSLCMVDNTNDYSKDKLLGLIQRAIASPYFKEVESSKVLNDLLDAVPIFTRQGLSYKWAHKSFMEYFAAQYLYIDRAAEKEHILSKIWASSGFYTYYNMLDLFYDMDRETFDRVLVYPLICNYLTDLEPFANNREHEDLFLYNQVMYNNFYYGIFVPQNEMNGDFNEIKPFLASKVRRYLPDMDDWTQGFTSRSSMFNSQQLECLYVKDYRVFKLMSLLSVKGHSILKELYPAPVKVESGERWFTYEDDCTKSPDTAELKHRVCVISDLIFTDNPGEYISYEEALKHKELIELQQRVNLDNPFANV